MYKQWVAACAERGSELSVIERPPVARETVLVIGGLARSRLAGGVLHRLARSWLRRSWRRSLRLQSEQCYSYQSGCDGERLVSYR